MYIFHFFGLNWFPMVPPKKSLVAFAHSQVNPSSKLLSGATELLGEKVHKG